LFETFGNGLKEKIQTSPEWRARENVNYQKEQNASANSGSGFDDMDDDIPF
jgi:single-stranded DNA-binding protein